MGTCDKVFCDDDNFELEWIGVTVMIVEGAAKWILFVDGTFGNDAFCVMKKKNNAKKNSNLSGMYLLFYLI